MTKLTISKGKSESNAFFILNIGEYNLKVLQYTDKENENEIFQIESNDVFNIDKIDIEEYFKSSNFNREKKIDIFEGITCTFNNYDYALFKTIFNIELKKYNKEKCNKIKLLTDKEIRYIGYITLVNYIIKDIRGIYNENGEEIKWSKDFGYELIENENFNIIFNKIIEYFVK